MPRSPDAISSVVRGMRRLAGSRASHINWTDVEGELRAYVTEFASAYSVPDLAPYSTFKIAGLRRSSELLNTAWRRFREAAKLAAALEDFGAKTYGQPGLVALPHEAMKKLDVALGLIAENLVRHDAGL